jgi:hypothetical protein
MTVNTTPLIALRRERRPAPVNPWGPLASAISFAGFAIWRVIDLDMRAHPEKSLTGILITDVLWPIVILFGFSVCFCLFLYGVGVWDRFLRDPPDRA